jgi:predicted acylesterase/phospholipase RssA
MTRPTVGLSVSGGGFRATAFGLGCLRALHDTGTLDRVTVVSGVSGGSLLAALWAYGPEDFGEFDDNTVALLRRGLQRELFRRVLSPSGLARSAASTARRTLPASLRSDRPYNRTDALRQALADSLFGDRLVSDPTRPGLSTVINATDLISSRAVRFGSDNSSCSHHGRIVDPVTVAEAVAASAAFPVALPAIERTFSFERLGQTKRARVNLTDGGVYDNLGLSVLEPDRSPDHTRHVYNVDYVVACDAGRQEKGSSGARLFPFRLIRSFDITYRKTQDASRSKLHAARAAGLIDGFVHTYLGMQSDLPVPVADLVPLSRVNDYPTDFKAMTADDLAAVTTRAEQLTRTLLAHYCPGLM